MKKVLIKNPVKGKDQSDSVVILLKEMDKKFSRKFDETDSRFDGILKKLDEHTVILRNLTNKVVFLVGEMDDMKWYIKDNLVHKDEFNKFLNSEDTLCKTLERLDKENTAGTRWMNSFDKRLTSSEKDITEIKVHVGMVAA